MNDRVPARARALAAELKVLRERSGLTTRAAAKRLGTSIASLNRSETGRRMASVADVSALLAIYGVTGPERKRIMAMAEEAATSGWWGQSRAALLDAFIHFEAQAESIITFSSTLVPGLVQTSDYARTVMRVGLLDEADAERRVRRRMERQKILFRPVRPTLRVFLDEAVLRRPFGGSQAMAAQIRWLIDLAKEPNCAIRVIPFRHGGYDLSACFTILEFRQLPRLVYLENKGASGFEDQPEDTEDYVEMVDQLRRIALDSPDSVDFMERIAADHDRG
ncbi:Helix-turn-helix domain-containing protein [Actinokineospora alba]|uniref:Helix-turn-helix domain-containing protein n=1 Tax=Actinokineospora alba TaxID=504798 RepID=A0A1H0KDK2_9PSEU|nr:helix-turn-helix transcriptional regulator [Actinokineospora alba]TDP67948.1 helix-turn-helix protein [Actinokineospora alba]SDH89465.1 Helix-turn-helix domain-containing protein [Actinokineospora alba]SDO53873.1 Helix-turn-helix domain-containing protein [Actinokineospora alba]